jgi:hypothetical protein
MPRERQPRRATPNDTAATGDELPLRVPDWRPMPCCIRALGQLLANIAEREAAECVKRQERCD